jgi:shikimate 5-dehydrogenase
VLLSISQPCVGSNIKVSLIIAYYNFAFNGLNILYAVYIAMCFERNDFESAVPRQEIRNFVGNRLVESHISGSGR